MDSNEFLSKIQRILSDFQQGDLFGNKEVFEDRSQKLCEEYLLSKGYSVAKPHKYPRKVTGLDELIKMFYGGMRNIFPRHLWSYYDEKKDRAIAKAFVEKRAEDDCVSYETALQQCGLIIQTVLDRPDIFKFETAPDFGIFGQAEMGWITNRAVELINKQVALDEAKAAERLNDIMTQRIEERSPHKGLSLDQIEATIKELEDKYGKKER